MEKSAIDKFLLPAIKPAEAGDLHKGRSSMRWNKADEQAGREGVTLSKIREDCENCMRILGLSGSVGVLSLSEDYLPEIGKNQIWIKVTQAKGGLTKMGVIGHGQLDFNTPTTQSEYNEKVGSRWRYSSSSILIHSVDEKWDTGHVILFTIDRSKATRGLQLADIKRAIGNFLTIKCMIPCVDFFNHQIVAAGADVVADVSYKENRGA